MSEEQSNSGEPTPEELVQLFGEEGVTVSKEDAKGTLELDRVVDMAFHDVLPTVMMLWRQASERAHSDMHQAVYLTVLTKAIVRIVVRTAEDTVLQEGKGPEFEADLDSLVDEAVNEMFANAPTPGMDGDGDEGDEDEDN